MISCHFLDWIQDSVSYIAKCPSLPTGLPSWRPSLQPNWTSIIATCNLWRNFDDIQDSWASVASIINYYGDNQDDIAVNAGPGHWNDPDMVWLAGTIFVYVAGDSPACEQGRMILPGYVCTIILVTIFY